MVPHWPEMDGASGKLSKNDLVFSRQTFVTHKFLVRSLSNCFTLVGFPVWTTHHTVTALTLSGVQGDHQETEHTVMVVVATPAWGRLVPCGERQQGRGWE